MLSSSDCDAAGKQCTDTAQSDERRSALRPMRGCEDRAQTAAFNARGAHKRRRARGQTGGQTLEATCTGSSASRSLHAAPLAPAATKLESWVNQQHVVSIAAGCLAALLRFFVSLRFCAQLRAPIRAAAPAARHAPEAVEYIDAAATEPASCRAAGAAVFYATARSEKTAARAGAEVRSQDELVRNTAGDAMLA